MPLLFWITDAAMLEQEIEERSAAGRLQRAVVAVHLYDQRAELDPIAALCAQSDVPLVGDAAESLGSSYKGRSPGTVWPHVLLTQCIARGTRPQSGFAGAGSCAPRPAFGHWPFLTSACN